MSHTFPQADGADVAAKASTAVDDVIANSQHLARQALHGLNEAVQDLQDATRPLLQAGSDELHDLADQGRHEWQRRSRQIRKGARRMGDNTLHYIQDEPVAAVLIAAASGAALLAVIGLISRLRHPKH